MPSENLSEGKLFSFLIRLIDGSCNQRCTECPSERGRADRVLLKGKDVVDALTFQAEIRRIEKLLYRIAWSYMGSNADAEDAVQDALIKAWERRESLRDLKLFRPWMARILTNQCKVVLSDDEYSEYMTKGDSFDPSGNVSMTYDEAVRKLKPEYSLLITLHYADGYSIQELADTLGLPPGTVKTRMRIARKQLGKTLLMEGGMEE